MMAENIKKEKKMTYSVKDAKKSVLEHVEALPVGKEVKLIGLVDVEIWEDMIPETRRELGQWFRKYVRNTKGFPMLELGKDDQNHMVYHKLRPEAESPSR